MYTDSTYLLNEVSTLPAQTIITKQLYANLLRQAKEKKLKHKMMLHPGIA